MSTDEIAKTIALLKVNTIQDALKQAGSAAANSKASKQDLIKLYETAVMDVGIEKFIHRVNEELVTKTAKLLGADAANQGRSAVIANVQSVTIQSLLSQASLELLKDYGTEMGLETTNDKKEMEQSIADEAMLTGMEGFLHKLNPATLKRHCLELSLDGNGDKRDLVERLMVHIFELEPLNPPSSAPSTKAEEEEEAKPKENKKRKDAPEKGDTPGKKAKKEKKEEKEGKKKDEAKENGEETPKRSTRGRKAKVLSDDEESEEEKKEKTPKKNKTPSKEEDTPSKTRTPWQAPPLSTIVKGKYDYQGFYDNFNLTDLQEYCRMNGLKGKGVKKDVIREILRFVETGEKTEEIKKKKRGRKAKTPTKTSSKSESEGESKTEETGKEEEK